MATREEAKAKLRKAGYSVVDDNSVLTVIIAEDVSVKNTVKNVKELLTKIEYSASFGVRQHKYSGEDGEGPEQPHMQGEFENPEDDDPGESKDYGFGEPQDGDFGEAKDDDFEESKEIASKKNKGSKSEAVVSAGTVSDSAKGIAANEDNSADEEDDFLDEEDDNHDSIDSLKADDFDGMLFTEDNMQFSLEDFGLM